MSDFVTLKDFFDYGKGDYCARLYIGEAVEPFCRAFFIRGKVHFEPENALDNLPEGTSPIMVKTDCYAQFVLYNEEVRFKEDLKDHIFWTHRSTPGIVWKSPKLYRWLVDRLVDDETPENDDREILNKKAFHIAFNELKTNKVYEASNVAWTHNS